MVRTLSTMLPLGTMLPKFSLPDTYGHLVDSETLQIEKGLLIVFMCNHCPFVKHIRTELAALGRDLPKLGITMLGINSNDVSVHPDDSPDKMKAEVEEQGYTFPYLFDETQEVAKAFHAACTPDFYLFDSHKSLYYRGQLDDSRPSLAIPVTGSDLRGAVQKLMRGESLPEALQKPSLGCNIKWRVGNEPDYFGS